MSCKLKIHSFLVNQMCHMIALARRVHEAVFAVLRLRTQIFPQFLQGLRGFGLSKDSCQVKSYVPCKGIVDKKVVCSLNVHMAEATGSCWEFVASPRSQVFKCKDKEVILPQFSLMLFSIPHPIPSNQSWFYYFSYSLYFHSP